MRVSMERNMGPAEACRMRRDIRKRALADNSLTFIIRFCARLLEMAALLERASQAVSITQVSRSAKKILKKLASGQEERLVVLKNNTPAAVLLSIGSFEALMDELDELRILTIARERLNTFDRKKAISHNEMMKRYGRRPSP